MGKGERTGNRGKGARAVLTVGDGGERESERVKWGEVERKREGERQLEEPRARRSFHRG